jgi:hypothetical protein
VWILMAVLELRRGARSDELRRDSCKRIFFVHEGSESFEIFRSCVCFRGHVHNLCL